MFAHEFVISTLHPYPEDGDVEGDCDEVDDNSDVDDDGPSEVDEVTGVVPWVLAGDGVVDEFPHASDLRPATAPWKPAL